MSGCADFNGVSQYGSPPVVIVLPLYAVLVWSAMYFFRRRLIGWTVWMLSWAPVAAATYLCVQYMPLPDHEPRPVWLYGIAGAYAGLILLVGGIIVSQRGLRGHHCHACGYDLSGNRAGMCPECGTLMHCHACHTLVRSENQTACHVCGSPFGALPAPVVREHAPMHHPPVGSRERIERYVRSVEKRAG